MKTKQRLFTVITGASTGLGKELAIECARRKMNLILVSLPDENLPELCINLSENYQVSVFHYETDLTDISKIEVFAKWVTCNFSVNVLINNAGIGGTRSFETTPTEYLDRLIQLNIRATSLITRLLIPELKMHRRAYILNVSSMAAFSPLPYKTIYPASKAFIYHFTRGLKAELQHTNIKVSVVNPGPIMTNADVTSRILKQGKLGKLALVSASTIARISVKNLMKGKAVIIPGFLNQINVFLMGLIPAGIKLALSTRIVMRELQ